MNIMQLLISCFPSSSAYNILNKKDDDYAIEDVEEFKKNYPIDISIGDISYAKVDEYAKKLLKSLSELFINSSNVEDIGNHLRNLAVEKEQLRQSLFSNLPKVKMDKDLCKNLRFRLESVASRY